MGNRWLKGSHGARSLLYHPPKIHILQLRGRLNGNPLDIAQLHRLSSAEGKTVMFENNPIVRYRQETAGMERVGHRPSCNLDSVSPAVRFLERDAPSPFYLYLSKHTIWSKAFRGLWAGSSFGYPMGIIVTTRMWAGISRTFLTSPSLKVPSQQVPSPCSHASSSIMVHAMERSTV